MPHQLLTYMISRRLYKRTPSAEKRFTYNSGILISVITQTSRSVSSDASSLLTHTVARR